jgi:hypothetical protein
MTNREFEDAVAAFQRGGRKAIKTDIQERVFVAVGQVMRNRLRLPDNEPYDAPTFPQRSPPSVLTTAACGGLRSAPDCRTRRAFLV